MLPISNSTASSQHASRSLSVQKGRKISDAEMWIDAERIDTPHTHGTGCTISAAIAAHLARGASLEEAVRAAKAFVTEAIRNALEIGDGIGPVDQLWPLRRA